MSNAQMPPQPKKIMLVVEDDGGSAFKFYLDGDVGNLGRIPISAYSAAEYWASQFLALCKEFLEKHGEVKLMGEATDSSPPPLQGA